MNKNLFNRKNIIILISSLVGIIFFLFLINTSCKIKKQNDLEADIRVKQYLKEYNQEKEKEDKLKNINHINGFEIISFEGYKDSISGKIKNLNDKEYSTVFVKFNLMDKEGNIIKSVSSSIENLEKDKIWNFNIKLYNVKYDSLKLTDIYGYVK